MEEIIINIAKDFSMFPAGRYEEDGDFSGTRFRDKILLPKLDSLVGSECVVVVFDGVAGFGSSFLEEAFGGLVRKGKTKEFLDKHLKFRTSDGSMNDFIRLAENYITDAVESAENG